MEILLELSLIDTTVVETDELGLGPIDIDINA